MKENKGTLGFILVIIAIIIALFSPEIGIVFLFLIYLFAFADSDKAGSDSDHPFL